VGQPRFTSQIVLFFASAALLLGALGIHGVLSYVVAQRVGELGVRIALGARPAAVLRFVLRQGMGLAAIGVVLGVGATLALAQLLRSLLFAVRPVDAISVAAAVALLAVAALLACLGPARRAARIDPIAALRAE
jgi:ABC-type antimicrobial peptide transport system permease subunit